LERESWPGSFRTRFLKPQSSENSIESTLNNNGESAMATNLVSAVMQFLTPDMIAKIASALGIDRSIAQKAIGGAVPALLSALTGLASTPNGARQLSNAVTQQSGSLENLKGLLSGSTPSSFTETGSSLLSGLFGSGAVDTMAQSIGKFAGVGESSGKSILGLLGPVIFGVLGQQQRSANLDAGGLASLLSSQKDQITSMIPAGLADQLNASGLLERAGGSVRSGVASASATASRIAGASERTVSDAAQAAYATRSAATTQLPYWLLALAIVGGLAWYAFGRPHDEVVAARPPATTPPPSVTVGTAPADLTIGGVNLANQVNSSFGTLKSVLPGITDAATAQAALPKLREANAQLAEIATLANSLNPERKGALAKLITAAAPTIDQMCDKVLAMPGVGDVAKPTIDELRRKIAALSQA
jgi:hypothetical protein